MQTMYPAIINSPATSLVANITAIQTTLTVTDGTKLPPAPNVCTIGRGDTAETILYGFKTGNDLSGIIRGFQGAAAAWNIGTPVARYITAYDMDTLKANIEDLNTPARSPAQTTQNPVTSYPTATEDGLVNGTIGGQSLVNGVTNGNFVNTTGWTGEFATIAASGNTLAITGSGTGTTPRVMQATSTPYASGKKIYTRAKGRVTNAVATSIMIHVDGSLGGTLVALGTVNTPVQNQWYQMSGIITQTDQTGNVRVRVRSAYADAATANGKVMEVRDVIAIDLDAHGLTSKTVAELDAMSDAYFDSLTSPSNIVVMSEAKNILPPILELGSFDASGVKSASLTRARTVNLIKVSPSRIYSAKCNFGGGFEPIAAFYYDSGLKLIQASATATNTIPFTTPSNCAYVNLTFRNSDNRNLTAQEILNIQNTSQLEEGSTPTTYEPYQSNTLSIPATLRSLPYGVRDTYDVATGKLTQNVSAEYTLLSGDVTALVTTTTNIDLIQFKKNTDYLYYNTDLVHTAMAGSLLSPLFKIGDTSDNAANVWNVGSQSTTLLKLAVPKGTYASLAAAQTALAGTKILYELATPVVTDLTEDKLVCFKGGRFYTNTAIVPQAVINTPINLAEKAESSFDLAQKAESKLSVLAMPITMVGPETTITNVAAALAEINTAFRTKYDLSKCSQARLAVAVKTIGSAAAEVRIQYGLDESTWNYLDGLTGPAVNISASGAKASAWGPIATLAKADVFLRAVTIGGDGAADPVIGNVTLQVR